jgi:enoyl-CoA hydratase/carnithine racemase
VWQDLFGVMRDLATSPLPTVAALTGHSPAGGTVLAVFCDHRVMADGAYVVGLNEVQVGLPVPEVLMRGLTHVVGARQAERLAVGGLLVHPAEALRCGLVDELRPLDEVVPRAITWARELLARPRVAMSLTRQRARRPLHEAFEALDDDAIEAMVDHWFTAETQTVMKALAAKLGQTQGQGRT